MIEFSVPGPVQGKQRARTVRVGGVSRTYTPAKTVAYEAQIAAAGHKAMREAGLLPLRGPLVAQIFAVHAPPASWSKKRRSAVLAPGAAPPVAKPDLDNAIKAVGDALNGVCWLDDSQLVAVAAVRMWAEEPCLRVTIAPWEHVSDC